MLIMHFSSSCLDIKFSVGLNGARIADWMYQAKHDKKIINNLVEGLNKFNSRLNHWKHPYWTLGAFYEIPIYRDNDLEKFLVNLQTKNYF